LPAVLLTLVLAATTLAVAPVTPALAAGRALPIARYADMVVDDVHERLFFSAGSGSSRILVTDFSGATLTTIPGQSGAFGMSLSADGSLLYAALGGADAISVIDTATLQEVTRYATGAQSCPRRVVPAGDRLWFVSSCDAQWGSIGSLLPGASPVVQRDLASVYGVAPLAVSPGAPGLLAVGDSGMSPPSLRVFDTSTGSLVAGPSISHLDGGSFRDLVFSADGTTLYAATGAPAHIRAFSAADLSNAGEWATGPYPVAVAVGRDGQVAAGRDGSYEPDVYLYPAGATSAVRSLEYDGPNAAGSAKQLQAGGLALSADADRLFVVTADYLGGTPTLDVVRYPFGLPTTLTLTGPATATRGAALQLTGTPA
jgi:YVTN family beta-propeller protein